MSPVPVFDPVSPQALASGHLLVVILAIGCLIFIFVCAWLAINAIRFRARPGQGEPYQEYGRRNLELAWTLTPAAILAVLFVLVVISVQQADPPVATASSGDPPAPDIVVTGNQWWWEIQYPAPGVYTANELELPIGKPVLIRLESDDVIHSLWLPQLRGKTDLIPGQTNYMWIQADRPGTYLGQCSEYCGTAHAWMLITATAVPQAQFDAWLRQQAQPASTPTTAEAAQGAKLFQQMTCVNCHAIGGTDAKARIGPDLTHFGSRKTLGSGVLENTQQNLETWLRDPQAVKPGVNMPNFHLTDSDVRALSAYLEGLK